MVRIRRFEEKVVELFASGQIQGSQHSSIGQEAVAAGMCATLRSVDAVTSTHRGHGHCLAKGARPDRMMAELFGKVTGYCRGKGGSMHIADFSIGLLGANGIVGGGLPVALGSAFAAKFLETGGVTVAFLGEGAANQGTFSESLNLAATWKLPVIFVCENNLYVMCTSQRDQAPLPDIYVRAGGYGMPGLGVDGMDALAVWRAASDAVARARRGEGPTLLEAKTYRLRGHSEGDPEHYRAPDEVAQWWEREPIGQLRAFAETQELVSAEEMEAIDREAQREIEAAVAFARESPEPDPAEATDHVYASLQPESFGRG
jgi:TPP-dependent pyruvate/acetoin dehydrogenase alpha subunit